MHIATDRYSIDFDFENNRFIATCNETAKQHVEKRPNVSLVQKALTELKAMSTIEINKMCDITFNRR